jgi:Flavin-binding monooxygenase-like
LREAAQDLRDPGVEFDDYVVRQRLRLRLECEVTEIARADRGWALTSTDGEVLMASALVVATGNYREPAMPRWPGIEAFRGRVVHSAEYRNAWPFAGQDVLVVGTGNSAADIAVQLSRDPDRRVWLAARTPPHLVRRSTFGVPADAFGVVLASWPVALVDRLGRWLRALTYGDLSAHGFASPPQGIYSTVLSSGRIPTLADELLAEIRAGRIEVVAAVEALTDTEVRLADRTTLALDAVIVATGFTRGLRALFADDTIVDADEHPRAGEAVAGDRSSAPARGADRDESGDRAQQGQRAVARDTVDRTEHRAEGYERCSYAQPITTACNARCDALGEEGGPRPGRADADLTRVAGAPARARGSGTPNAGHLARCINMNLSRAIGPARGGAPYTASRPPRCSSWPTRSAASAEHAADGPARRPLTRQVHCRPPGHALRADGFSSTSATPCPEPTHTPRTP